MEATTKSGKVITGKFAALMIRIGAATPVELPVKKAKIEIPKIEVLKEEK